MASAAEYRLGLLTLPLLMAIVRGWRGSERLRYA
jgi:hypothetical protein